jgi:hypothetical protein
LEDDKSYALDLYSYGAKIYLSILDLKSNEYWSIVVAEKTAEEIMQVLLGWSVSLNLPLHELCFLTDRGGEFEDNFALCKISCEDCCLFTTIKWIG